MRIEVCMGTNCMMNGSMELFDQLSSFNELIEENPEDYKVENLEVVPIKCQKNCKLEEEYKDVTIIIDGDLVHNLKGAELLERVMNTIKK